MSCFDKSELEWQFIRFALPSKSRGVKRVDDRRVIIGILRTSHRPPLAQLARRIRPLHDGLQSF